MRTLLQAMLWELWRISRFPLLARISGLAAIVIFIGSAARISDEPTVQVFRGLLLSITVITSVFTPTWINDFEGEHVGFSFRLGFMRPISTTRLVAIPFFYAISTSVLCYWLNALLFGWLTETPLPIVVPTAFIICIVACLLAALWAPTTMVSRAIACAALLLGSAFALAAYHNGRGVAEPMLLAMGKPDYFVFDIVQSIGLLAVTALAFAVTLFAVDHQRHGGRWEIDCFRLDALPRLRGRSVVASHDAKPFTSPIAAQFWYEMRRFGGTLLLLSVIAPTAVFVFAFAIRQFETGMDSSPFIWLVAIIICSLTYQIIGVDGALSLKRSQGAVEFFTFIGTQPIRSDQLVTIKLLAIAVCSLVGFLCMGVAAGLDATFAGDWDLWFGIGETASLAVGDVSAYWWFAGLCTAVLIYVSSSSILFAGVLCLAHRWWLIPAAMAFLIGNAMLAQWDSRHGWSLWILWTAYGYVIPIAVFIGCIIALRKAFSAGFLASRLFGCALCLWVICVGSTVFLFINASPATPIPTTAVLLGSSLLLVPLAATAIAPLAFDSHRHG